MIKINENKDHHLFGEVLSSLTQLLDDSQKEVRSAAAIMIIRFLKNSIRPDTLQSQKIFEILMELLKEDDSKINPSAFDHIKTLINLEGKRDLQLMKTAIEAFTLLLNGSSLNSNDLALKVIIELLKMNEKYNTQLTKFLTQVSKQNDNGLKKIVFDSLNKLRVEGEASESKVVNTLFETLIPFLDDPDWAVKKTFLAAINKLINIGGNHDIGRLRKILEKMIPFLGKTDWKDGRSILCNIFELVEISKASKSQFNAKFFMDVFNMLSPFLEDSNFNVRIQASKDIASFMRRSNKSESQLCKEILKAVKPLLKHSDFSIRNTSSDTIIRLMEIFGQNDTQLVQEILKILTQFLLKNSPWSEKELASENLIKLLENHPEIAGDFFNTSNQLLDLAIQKGDLMPSDLVLKVLLYPDNLSQYINDLPENLKKVLLRSISTRLSTYVQIFVYFENLFQDPKSSLTFDKIQILFREREISDKTKKEIQLYLEKLQTHEILKNDYFQLLSELKSLLASELNQIKNLKGPQLIELAMIIFHRDTILEMAYPSNMLPELAQEILNIQAKFLNEEGLIWINRNYDNLPSASNETKAFLRKVFHKILEKERITPLEEELMIKLIHQGFTISLARSGEIIFEGKYYRLQGDNIEQTFQKFAKIIFDQQQDTLALQYKNNEPIFPKKFEGGMKEAAADKREVLSIADKRYQLKIDFWLLTTLKSLKSNPEIIILEKRTVFGDHFIYRLTDDPKQFQFYPNETPELEDIFGSYKPRECYSGEVKELTDEIGQQLLDSKDTTQVSQIEGRIFANQIYYQQKLLRKGSEDMQQGFQEALGKKLDDNHALLKNFLASLSIADSQKLLIKEYCNGFLSTFTRRFLSAQVIADGKLTIDDGTDKFNLINLFFQLSQKDPFGIGYVLAEGLNAIRSHLKITPIINSANFTADIAIDVVEASNLAWKTVLDIISIEENRQRIFDAKDERVDTCWKKTKKILSSLWTCECLGNMVTKCVCGRNCAQRKTPRTPAFQLGGADVDKALKKWVNLKHSNPRLQIPSDELREKFAREAVDDTKKKKTCCSRLHKCCCGFFVGNFSD